MVERVYSTLFAATQPELTERFVGWLEPRAKAVLKECFDPFTGAIYEKISWFPSKRAVRGGDFTAALLEPHGRARPPIVKGKGEFANIHKESRGPAALDSLPHAVVRNFDLRCLIKLLGFETHERPARIAPDDTSLPQIRDQIVRAIERSTAKQVHAIAEELADDAKAVMTSSEAQWALTCLHALSKDAVAHNRVVCEWLHQEV